MQSDKSTFPVGVSILLVNRDGRVALGWRPVNIPAGGFLSTPGGRIEETEHLEETAARELEEETGVQLLPTQFKILGFKEHFRFTGHYFMIYVAAYYDGQLKLKEPDKCLGWDWWKLEEIPADRCTEPPDILAMLAKPVETATLLDFIQESIAVFRKQPDGTLTCKACADLLDRIIGRARQAESI